MADFPESIIRPLSTVSRAFILVCVVADSTVAASAQCHSCLAGLPGESIRSLKMTHMRLIGTRGILLAFVVLAVLVQAYALPLEWSRELLGTEDAALPTTAADSTGGSLDVSATSTCPSAETYRKTKRGCCESLRSTDMNCESAEL